MPNFRFNLKKYGDGRSPFMASQKPNRGEKQLYMVPREPGINHSTQCPMKTKMKKTMIHPQGQCGPPTEEFKKLINLIYKRKFSLVFNLFKFT